MSIISEWWERTRPKPRPLCSPHFEKEVQRMMFHLFVLRGR